MWTAIAAILTSWTTPPTTAGGVFGPETTFDVNVFDVEVSALTGNWTHESSLP